MSRHRDIRNLDYDQEYDEAYDDSVYGHSVDDEYGVSPSAEQYLYSQKGDYGFGAYFPGTENIKEEEEDLDARCELPSRRDSSSSYERPRLTSEDEVRLNSVLDEIRNVVGEVFSEAELVRSVLDNKYDFEAALHTILNRKPSSSSSSASASGKSRAQSASSQSQTSLPAKAKKQFSAGSQSDDGSCFLSPFSSMLPLSYSFSSAFIFEPGRFERIPASRMVKEWYTVSLKNKIKGEKWVTKEMNRERERSLSTSSLPEAEDVKAEDLSSEIGLLSVNSEFPSDDEKSEAGGVSCQELPSHNRLDASIPSLVKLANTAHAHSGTPSPPSKSEVQIPRLSILPTQNKSVPSNGASSDQSNSFGDLKFSLPSQNKDKLSFGSPGRSSLTNQPPSLSQGLKTSKLASLASAHLAQAGVSSLPLNIASTPSLKGESLSQSPLSALASAHFAQSDNKFSIPTFSSTPPKVAGDGQSPLQNREVDSGSSPGNSFKAITIPSLTLNRGISNGSKLGGASKGFSIPPLSGNKASASPGLSSLSLNTSGSGESNKFVIPSLFPGNGSGFGCDTDAVPAPTKPCRSSCESQEEDSMEVDDGSLSAGEEERLPDTIDLNLALNKIQPAAAAKPLSTEHASSAFHLSHYRPELFPGLTADERRLLASGPFSLFGKTLIQLRRRRRRPTPIYHRYVSVPFKAFDFASPSPDDLVKAALLNQNYADKYKLMLRERRPL